MNTPLAQGNFFGHTLKNFQAAGFNLSESHYAPHSELPRHSHEAPYFGFVLRGTYTERYGRETRACRPSMLIYHPAGELHAQYFNSTSVRLFRLEVNQQLSGSLRQANVVLGQPRLFGAGLITILARRLYHEFRNPDEVSHLVVEGLALELVAAIARADPRKRVSLRPPEWLGQAHDLVRSHCAESITTAEIARTVGVHPVTLTHEFRRYYGFTIGEMVRSERIALACRGILAGARLADVAVTTGFYDQSHFAKTFKRVTGLTPGQYRADFRSS
jgi:AraC family transcriptional regulator